MLITKKRIRNIVPYIRHIKDGTKIVVGISDLQHHIQKIQAAGFSQKPVKGQSILPSGIFGPISSFNADGKEIKHKDQPMETAYRQAEWHWTEWHGRYERVEQSKIVDIPYQRYPRSFVPPPSVELTISEDKNGNLLLVSVPIEKNEANKATLTHVVNLFLEIFGECQFFTDGMDSIIKTTLVRLNWKILPQGQMPWEQLQEHVKPLIDKAPKGNQIVITHRLETINKLKPNFTAIGLGGFHGYIIHGFSERNIFILESMYYGNATYVFGESWEDLSRRTKAEILNENLQKDRVIHRDGWEGRVKNLLKE